jgi:hypothetical protein
VNISAFLNCSNLTTVDISSATAIGTSAFQNCSKLTAVNVPNSVTSVGTYAFQNCSSLTSVGMGSATILNTNVFQGCSKLTAVNVPNSVTSLGNFAFQDCSGLQSIYINKNVTAIGTYTFSNCTSLTSVVFDPSATLKTIGGYAFYKSGVTNLVIPNSVTSISIYAFSYMSNLTSVTLPPDLSGALSAYLFKFSTCLQSIVIPNKITSFDVYHTFYSCSSLTSVTLPDTLTDLGSGAFSLCTSLQQITLPSKLKTIGGSVLRDCSGLLSITIPDSVTFIDTTAFLNDYSLTSVTLSNSVTSLGSTSFSSCISLRSIVIPNSVITISRVAFNACSSLTSITLGNCVQTIEDYAFQHCSSLQSISIPSSVTSISSTTFNFCYAMTNFFVDPSNANYSDSSGVLFNKDKTRLLYYPLGNARTTYEIPTTVTAIEVYAFDTSEDSSSALTNIIVPSTVSNNIDFVSLQALTRKKNATITLDLGRSNLVFPTKTTQISIVNTRMNMYRIFAADGITVLQETLIAEVPFTYDGVTIVIKNMLMPPMQLVFTDFLNLAIHLSSDGSLPQLSASTPMGEYTLERDISLSTIKSVFYFQTDDPITYDASYTKYYVDISGWQKSTMAQDLNPMYYQVVSTSNGAFGPNTSDNLGKHFLRYIAQNIFGTYLGVDLFENEDEVYADISTNVLNYIQIPIINKLKRVDTFYGQTSTLSDIYIDVSGGYYLRDSEGSYNICRNLVKQMSSNNISCSRFQSLEVRNGQTGVYNVPFVSGDSIYYSCIVSPGPDQHAVTGKTSTVESKKYILKLNIV